MYPCCRVKLLQLHHRNLNEFIGAYISSPAVYMCMAFCSKGSVWDVINCQSILLSLDFRLSLVIDIAKVDWNFHGLFLCLALYFMALYSCCCCCCCCYYYYYYYYYLFTAVFTLMVTAQQSTVLLSVLSVCVSVNKVTYGVHLHVVLVPCYECLFVQYN